VCIHGDKASALAFAKALRAALENAQVMIRAH
jgi:lactam utilization protein B